LFLILGANARDSTRFGSSGGWLFLIAIGGILLAGRAFERMHDGRGASDWLLLPASSEEKYLSAFGVYLVAYPAAAIAAAVIVSLALSLIGFLLGSGSGGVWNPVRAVGLKDAGSYALFVAFALAGSARFRKITLVKTAAVSIGWMVFLGFTGMALLALFTEEGRAIFASRGHFSQMNFNLPEAKSAALEILGTAMKIGSFAFAVLYGYFRVAEKEAVDEVQ